MYIYCQNVIIILDVTDNILIKITNRMDIK